MFDEIAPRRKGAFFSIFFIVVSAFLLLSLPHWISPYTDFFRLPFALTGFELCVFLLLTFCVHRFLRTYSAQYKYSLLYNSVSVVRRIGSRSETLVCVALGDDFLFVPYADRKSLSCEIPKIPRKHRYGISELKKSYILVGRQGNEEFAMIFQPSEKFVEILLQKRLDKSEKK